MVLHAFAASRAQPFPGERVWGQRHRTARSTCLSM
jgi:hypothetical protein